MSGAVRRRGLPAAVPAEAALYLKPIKFREPGIDGAVELIVRQDARITRVVSTAEILDLWAARQTVAVATRIAALRRNVERSIAVDWAMPRTPPLVMGIVNATPDSFSDGGDHADRTAAIAHGRRLIEEGADVVDVGGESTRPGASPPTLEAELERVIPVIEALAPHAPMISIDTRRAAVMKAALGAGATMLNDVSALCHDHASLALAARHDGPVVLVHMQGTPEIMQRAPRYDCAPLDVFDFLEARIAACEAAGIPRRRLIVDPGIGFGKTLAHNLEILRDLALFRGLGCPVMVGVSRKGFIGRITGAEHPKGRLPGSLAAALHAVGEGAAILRVHDVTATRQALAMWTVLRGDQTQETP